MRQLTVMEGKTYLPRFQANHSLCALCPSFLVQWLTIALPPRFNLFLFESVTMDKLKKLSNPVYSIPLSEPLRDETAVVCNAYLFKTKACRLSPFDSDVLHNLNVLRFP